MSHEVIIRAYRPDDRPAIEKICAETGLRGKLHHYFCDTELFTRIWLAPYLVKENPDNLVVEVDGEVAGYLIASIGPGFRKRVVRCCLPLLCVLVGRFLRGKYRHHPQSSRFVRWLLTRSWAEYPRYPAGMESHFHFNLREDARRFRSGIRMMDMFHSRVEHAGLPGWHGIVFMDGARSARMYERLGLTIGESRNCSLFRDEKVMFTCFYRRSES